MVEIGASTHSLTTLNITTLSIRVKKFLLFVTSFMLNGTLSAVMLSVFILSVVGMPTVTMLNVILLNVAAPLKSSNVIIALLSLKPIKRHIA